MQLIVPVVRAIRLASIAIFAVVAACGGGEKTVITPPTDTPTLSVSVTPTTMPASSIAAGVATVSIVRGGGFTGSVSLLAENLPAGVTAVFSSSTLAAGATSTSLTLNIGPTAVAGVTSVTIRAIGTGVAAANAALQLTVQLPSINLTASSASVAVIQGSAASFTLTLERLGGFAGAVTVVADGLPANVSANFSPATFAAGVSTSTLTISTGANVPAGPITFTVRGSGVGVADRTLQLQLVVQAPAPLPVSLKFCDLTRIPVFFAVRDASGGPWRTVTAVNNTFSWTWAGNVGTFALVWLSPTNRLFTVFETYMSVYSTTSVEMAGGIDTECFLQPLRGKSLTGIVTPSVSATELAFVSAGWGNALLNPGGSAFTLADVAPDAIDLLATRFSFNAGAGGYQPSQFILRRGVNQNNGSNLAALDFNSSEAFSPATATVTVANLNGERASVRSAFNPVKSAQLVIDNGIQSTASVHTQYGFPTERMQTGELQEAMVTAADATNAVLRQVVRFSRAPSNQTLTLGASPNVPTLSVTNSTVSRPRARGSLQTDYNKSVTVLFTQTLARKQAWISVSPGFLGAASSYDIEVPDLLSVSGFNPAWGLTVGSPTAYSLYMSNAISSFSNGFPGTFSLDGATFLFASRIGNVP